MLSSAMNFLPLVFSVGRLKASIYNPSPSKRKVYVMNHILQTHTLDVTVRSCSSTTFVPFKTCNNANINEKDRGAWYIEHWADIFFFQNARKQLKDMA